METKRILKIGALVVVSLMLISSLAGYLYVRSMLYKEPIYDNIPPELPAEFGRDNRPAILVFSKTNGFRHEFAIPAGQKMLEKLAASRGCPRRGAAWRRSIWIQRRTGRSRSTSPPIGAAVWSWSPGLEWAWTAR